MVDTSDGIEVFDDLAIALYKLSKKNYNECDSIFEIRLLPGTHYM